MNDRTDTALADLLPCPFCGCEAELEHLENTQWSVGCLEGDHGPCIGYQSFTTFARRSEAIAAWNQRAALQYFEATLRPMIEAEVVAWLRSHREFGGEDFGPGLALASDAIANGDHRTKGRDDGE